jgi:hypothetical protein
VHPLEKLDAALKELGYVCIAKMVDSDVTAAVKPGSKGLILLCGEDGESHFYQGTGLLDESSWKLVLRELFFRSYGVTYRMVYDRLVETNRLLSYKEDSPWYNYAQDTLEHWKIIFPYGNETNYYLWSEDLPRQLGKNITMEEWLALDFDYSKLFDVFHPALRGLVWDQEMGMYVGKYERLRGSEGKFPGVISMPVEKKNTITWEEYYFLVTKEEAENPTYAESKQGGFVFLKPNAGGEYLFLDGRICENP